MERNGDDAPPTMKARLTYVIKFVADMDKAVRFHRDILGLTLDFASSGWSEFKTGDVRLALHPATSENPPGSVELGYGIDDLMAVYQKRERLGLSSLQKPKAMRGRLLSTFLDCENVPCRISGPLHDKR